jgi:hypothetical protein
MDPVSAITSAAPFWGPIVGILLLVAGYLFKELRAENKSRIEDNEKHRVELTALLTKSIENDKDQTHALMALTDVIKGRANV